MSENKELFTVLEAAKYLGVSRTKISQLISDKELVILNNPLDKRQSLITKEQLDKLKTFPKAPKLKEEAPPPAPAAEQDDDNDDQIL